MSKETSRATHRCCTQVAVSDGGNADGSLFREERTITKFAGMSESEFARASPAEAQALCQCPDGECKAFQHSVCRRRGLPLNGQAARVAVQQDARTQLGT